MGDISWEDFEKVELRVGTIVKAEKFDEVKKPAYKLLIDFGEEIGTLKSSAQITRRYTFEELPGRQIVAVVNFPPKQVANMMSECLVLGVMGKKTDVVLLSPDQKVPNGLRIG